MNGSNMAAPPRALRLGSQGERGVVAPLVPRADVDLHVLDAGPPQRQVLERAAPQPHVAVADDGLARGVAVLLQLLDLLLELGLVLEHRLAGLGPLVAGVLGEGREDRAGNGAAALHRLVLAGGRER